MREGHVNKKIWDGFNPGTWKEFQDQIERSFGTQITKEEMDGVTVPTCVVAVENDTLFPDEIREEGRKAMEAKKLDHEFTVYPDVPHGFAVLGDYEDGRIVEEQKQAFQQMLAWLKGH